MCIIDESDLMAGSIISSGQAETEACTVTIGRFCDSKQQPRNERIKAKEACQSNFVQAADTNTAMHPSVDPSANILSSTSECLETHF